MTPITKEKRTWGSSQLINMRAQYTTILHYIIIGYIDNFWTQKCFKIHWLENILNRFPPLPQAGRMAWSPGASKRSRHDTNPYEFPLKTPNLILSNIKPQSAGFLRNFCHSATKKHSCHSYQGYLQKESSKVAIFQGFFFLKSPYLDNWCQEVTKT